jgi:hypothetical protein
MDWRPIDFYGIVNLNQGLIEQIDHYLQEKETRLANQLLHSLPGLDSARPILPSGNLKLSEVVEGFNKRIRLLSHEQLQQIFPAHGKGLVDDLNATFWELTEVLEGCVVELFQQIKQVSVHEWHQSLAPVVQAIKDILVHYLDDLKWTIRRLENPLHEAINKVNPANRGMGQWLSRSKVARLDPALMVHLTQSEKLLKEQYEDFCKRYGRYQLLNVKVEEALAKMKTYPILALLDIEDQNVYVDVFRLLKFCELNPHGTLAEETMRSLKRLYSIQAVIKIFRIYYQELKDAFFRSSIELKALMSESKDFETAGLLEKVKEYDRELHSLIATMGRYREFILQTDANPYVRSRLGFKEWPVAPEPPKARALLNRIYLAEELKRWYESFIEALRENPASQERKEYAAHQEIDRLLHEMSQPLISQSMMHNRADQLLTHIKECDEISSSHFETIGYIGNAISKAMRADWKYHVLHEFPLFHEIYRIHRGLEKQPDDPAHAFRMERFYDLFDQIEAWVNKGDVYTHVHEIEQDINDMKTYLQDFLAAIQRASKEKSSDPFLDETIQRFRQQLLEYRYIFGQFFLNITSKNTDGQQLRNQFLFVDQYFESIESLLNELELSWKGDR